MFFTYFEALNYYRFEFILESEKRRVRDLRNGDSVETHSNLFKTLYSGYYNIRVTRIFNINLKNTLKILFSFRIYFLRSSSLLLESNTKRP